MNSRSYWRVSELATPAEPLTKKPTDPLPVALTEPPLIDIVPPFCTVPADDWPPVTPIATSFALSAAP